MVELKKDNKRKKIIAAAVELFAKNNYHEVMMEDVAKTASIAKGTLYNYFNSKEDLYFDIIKYNYNSLLSSLNENLKNSTDPLESLKLYISHLFNFFVDNKNFFLLAQKESLNNGNISCNDIKSLKQNLRDALVKILNKGLEENLFRKITPDFYSDLVLGSIRAAANRCIENENCFKKRDEESSQLTNFLTKGALNLIEFPLAGKNIVLTRTLEQTNEANEKLTSLGAKVISFPVLEITPPDSWNEFDDVVKNFNRVDYIIFTSSNAVKMYNQRCSELNIKPDYNRTKIIAVGNKTSAYCEKLNIPIHLIPKEFSSNGLIAELNNYGLTGKTVFIPRSVLSNEELPVELSKIGAIVKTAYAYNVTKPSQNTIMAYLDNFNKVQPDIIIFTSPSTFNNFKDILEIEDTKSYFDSLKIAAIGPTTKKAIEENGVPVSIVPSEYTMDGLIEAIKNFYN